MVSLRAGGIYTKAQLQQEVETLATCGMFEKVDLQCKTKPDGTLAAKVIFSESIWMSADQFRCINVGLMAQQQPDEMDTDMTDREKISYYRLDLHDRTSYIGEMHLWFVCLFCKIQGRFMYFTFAENVPFMIKQHIFYLPLEFVFFFCKL